MENNVPPFQPGAPFSLGVNYWPRNKAMYWWKEFDVDEVQEEFALIRDLGLRLVRIFLLWEDFQPTPDSVSETALSNLETVCDIARDFGLLLDVTFFTGHMSGPNWAPGWMLTPDTVPTPWMQQLVSGGRVVESGYLNPFTDSVPLGAAEILLTKVVTRLQGHPGVGIWNLGNEPDLFAIPPDAAAGRAWVRNMTARIKDIDPNTPVTCGLHVPSLIMDNGLRVHDVFAETDLAVIHGYPMYAEWAHDPLDPDFVPYLCGLTTALSGKPTMAEEFGGPTEKPGNPSSTWMWEAFGKPRTQFMASEEAFADYIEQVLPKLVEAGSTGAVLWCFADYVRDLWDKPPCDQARHERFFGLIRPDGSLKPHAEVLRKFAETNPVIQHPTKKLDIKITAEEFYENPNKFVVEYYDKWNSL
jgi:endo-1,4-beta-mannosidase